MEELKLNCIHEMYTSAILNQQIKYSILEEKYNNLLGNNYITEEADQKKQSIFKKALDTIKRWIGKLITFITKTIPNWIKKQAEKIANLFKKRKNAKVIDVSKLPKTHQEKVKQLANSTNAATKASRKVEEIKAELKNPEDNDSYLVNSLRQMNAEMQRQTNAAFDDLNNTEYNAAMNITNRHAYLQQVMKEHKEQMDKSYEEMDRRFKEIDELLKRDPWENNDKKDKTMKKQDQTAEELDSILDDIKDARDKKEDIVIVDTPMAKLKGYRGMYCNKTTIDNCCGIFDDINGKISKITSDFTRDIRHGGDKEDFKDTAYYFRDDDFDEISKLLKKYKEYVNELISTPLKEVELHSQNQVWVNRNPSDKELKEILSTINNLNDDKSLDATISGIQKLLSLRTDFIKTFAKFDQFVVKVNKDFAANAVAVYE